MMYPILPVEMKTLKEELKDILFYISWGRVARNYLGKPAKWIYDKLEGVDPVTESDREQIKEVLLNLSESIRIHAEKL